MSATTSKNKTAAAKAAEKAPEDSETTEEATPEDEILDNELERMVPSLQGPIQLSDGTYVHIRPLKLKELFAAFKIITRGSAMSMGAASFSILQDNSDQFAETLIALLINAVPEADQEFAEFLRVVVDPVAPDEKKGWKDRDERLNAEIHLDEILEDPEIEDAIDIVSTLITREAQDIQRLGKKIANAARMFGKVAPKTPQK